MRGRLTLQGLEQAVAEGAVDTVLVAQTDMQGRLVGKRFQAEFFLAGAHRETHGCTYLLATDYEMETVPGYKATSWATGYGDHVMRPDLSTMRRVPWLEGTALVLCDVLDHHGHAEVPHGPRAVLRRQVRRAEALGLRPMMASELEFFLYEQSFRDAHALGYRGLTPSSPYNADYHIFQTTKEEEVIRAIRTGLNAAGIPVESSKGEASAGQAEINVQYDEAIPAADAHVITKNAAKEIAWAKGYGDYVMRPDLATLRRLPWLEGTALVLCDVLDHHGHAEVPHSPRAVLRRQVRRAEALRKSTSLRAAFGDEVVDHYLRAARWEQSEYDRVVTDWEIARGFERA